MPMEYIIPSLCIAATIGINDDFVLEGHIAQLIQLNEDHFIAGFYYSIEIYQQKAWNDRHTKNKHFQKGDLVLLYDSKFTQNRGKLQMHFLGPCVINFITEGGAVQLQQLDGAFPPKLVNGSRVNPYKMGLDLRDA